MGNELALFKNKFKAVGNFKFNLYLTMNIA